MNEFQAIMTEAARMPDEAFFEMDSARLAALKTHMGKAIRSAGLRAPYPDPPYPDPQASLACAAPTNVHLARHPAVPLLVMTHTNGLREWMVRSRTNMLLVASDLETGAMRVIRPMDGDKRMREQGRSTDAPVPDTFKAMITQTGAERLNVLDYGFDARLGLHVALSVILYDVPSNVVSVRVISEERRIRRAPFAVPTPFLRPLPFAGAPGQAGAMLKLPGAKVAGGAPFLVEGHVRLTPPTHAPVMRAAGDTTQPLLPVSLLFVQKDRRAADSINLLVPVRRTADGMVEAGFRFDLWDSGTVPPGRSRLYLVTGDQLAGPYELERAG